MRLHSGYEDRKARLEMISLMDVMFLILVFFVYSIFSMSVHHGVKVLLPTAQGEREKGERIVITITADNELALNRKPMLEDALVHETVALAKAQEKPVLISADRKASMGVGIGLLEKLRTGGIQKVSFQVEPEKEAKPR
jgi:biopolymer transport protein ExbD